MGDFNFHFENVENKNSRKLHDIIDMFNLTQSVSEPTHNQGHLLDLVFSKQSDNILTSTKLHHGLTSDHTTILCKLDVSVPVQKPKTFLYRCLKKIDTGAFKQDLSHAVSQVSSISDYNNHLCSVLEGRACSLGTPSSPRKKTALASHSERIKYTVTCMCFSAINGSGPAYLSELLHVYTPSRTLHSSSDTRMLEIQQYKRKTHGFRTFSCFGPHLWNSLPQDLRHCATLSSFKAKLKTFLFSQYFHPN